MYGFDIPSSVQPSDAANMIPGQPEPMDFGTLLGGQQQDPRAAMKQANPDLAAAPAMPEAPAPAAEESPAPAMNFGQLFSPKPPREQMPLGHQTPGVNRDPQREQEKQDSAVDRTVADLNQTLSPHEKAAQGADADKSEMDALIAETRDLLGDSPVAASEIDDNAPSNPYRVFTPEWFKAEVQNKAARFRASFGNDKKEELAAAKSMYENGKGGRAEMRNGVIYFRTKEGEKMRRLDDKAFEFISDLFIDHAGLFTEGGVAAATQVAQESAAVGLAATGVGAPGAIASQVGMPLVSGAAGALAKVRVKQAMDAVSDQKQIADDDNLWAEVAWGSGINATGHLMFKGAGKAYKTIAQSVNQYSAMLPEKRIAHLATLRVQFEDFARQVGGSKIMQGLKETGRKVFGVIDDLGDQLQQNVTMVKQKALQLADQNGMESFHTESLLSKLKENLENRFIEFDEHGFAKLPRAAAESDHEWAQGIKGIGERGQELAEGAVDASQQELRAQQVLTRKAFGSDQGDKIISKLTEDYNQLLAAQKSKGGVPLKVLMDHIEAYRRNADLEKVLFNTEQETAVYRELQNAAASDRHAAFQQVFTGSNVPEAEIYDKAFKQYATKIDDVVQFRTLFANKESANQFAASLVQPQNSERILKLKSILGGESKEWNAFRGEYLDNFVNESLDPNTGILNTADLNKRFTKLGRDVIGSMFSDSEQKTLTKMMLVGNKIPFKDLLEKDDKVALRDMLIAIAPIQQFASTRFRMLWAICGKSRNAVEYLKDEGFMDAARNAPDKAKRDAILALQSFTEQVTNKMKVVRVERTDPKTKKNMFMEMYVPAAEFARKAIGSPAGQQGAVQGAKELYRMAEPDPASPDDAMNSPQLQ